MSRTNFSHFASATKLVFLTLLLVSLIVANIPSTVYAKSVNILPSTPGTPTPPPPTPTTPTPTPTTTTFIIKKSEERSFTSCQFTYTGDNAETCSGYNGYPCTCTINCPSCLTEENTCTGLSVNVINAICGNSGWQEADRMAEWHFYTVEKRITQEMAW